MPKQSFLTTVLVPAGVLVAVVAAVALLIVWAIISWRKPAWEDPVTGATVLHYSWAFRTMALVSAFGMPLFFFVMLLTVAPLKDYEELYYLLAATFIFISLGSYLSLEFLCVRVDLTEDGIRKVAPWHRCRFLGWEEITDVSFSRVWKNFVFVGPRQKIRIPIQIVGMREVIAAIRRHLDPSCYEEAEKGFDLLARWGLGGRR